MREFLHDLNNQLAIVMGYLELAQAHIAHPEKLTPLLAMAQQGAENMSELIKKNKSSLTD